MTITEWVKKCMTEGRLLSQIPSSWTLIKRVKARRMALERLTKVRLDEVPESIGVLEKAFGKNVEQEIGATPLPLGIAGPLTISGKYASGKFFIPLATTEGALVASVNRGCKAIAEAGGVVTHSIDRGMTRGPVFRVENLKKGLGFQKWLSKNFRAVKEVSEKTSSHLKLLDVTSQIVGRNVFVRMRFDTQEAMGMNMATIATQAAVDFIEQNTKSICVSLSGNYCVDKKPAWINVIEGRGKQVWAEVVIPEAVIREVLEVSTDELVEVFYRKVLVGSAVSGSMGFNGHFANIIAAIYLATGQDVAHVVHGAAGISTAEKVPHGVQVSCYLPNIIVGTVGGGTQLLAQKTALAILGLGKGEKGEAMKLSEIIGGAVLAGEISLLSSLAEGSLAKAHVRFGRGGSRS